MDQNNRYVKYLPILFSIVLIIGIIVGSRLTPVSTSNKGIFNIDLSGYDKLSDVVNYILKEYVDSVSRKDLTEEAIDGILTHLDPHSQYIPAEDFNIVNDPLIGNFEGIGIQFRIEEDTIMVVRPIPGGPSEKVGLMAGDRIVTVDDSLIAGVGVTDQMAMSMLKGKRGTNVRVSIFRRGIDELLDFVIIRDIIPTYSVDVYFMPVDSVGYIKVSKFSATTFDEFVNATDNLKARGMTKLILDLRQNSGGYLQAAIDMADEFLEKGKLIVYTEGHNQPRETFYATKSGNLENKELIILIDGGSASASEIVAGAIQDNDRGLIVGRRSYGKGLVQRQLDFIDGSALRLTVARYYTPTGRCIQKPYNPNEGFDEYFEESYHRYENGELQVRDSIHFNDSLKYVTPEGKVVYGGGGIMPDVFIPLEKDKKWIYYNKLATKGLIFKYAFEYTDRNRKQLKKYDTFEKFDSEFEIDNSFFNKFLKYAEDKGVMTDTDGLEYSSDRIKILLKAYIARNLFDDKGFYPIYLRIDDAFNKSLEIFSEEK
jgi:carboxyl-terminal processing protease